MDRKKDSDFNCVHNNKEVKYTLGKAERKIRLSDIVQWNL